MYTCVCVCMYNFLLFFPFWAYLTAGCLTLCFSSIQSALVVRQPVVGPATRRFWRAFISLVSLHVSRGWVLRYCGWVQVLISYHHLPCICLCFLCFLCVCVCVFVSRCAPADKQTQWRDLRNSTSTNVLTNTHAEITRTPLSCGGDECDADSLSLLIHTYIHRHTSMFVCVSEYTWQLVA